MYVVGITAKRTWYEDWNYALRSHYTHTSTHSIRWFRDSVLKERNNSCLEFSEKWYIVSSIKNFFSICLDIYLNLRNVYSNWFQGFSSPSQAIGSTSSRKSPEQSQSSWDLWSLQCFLGLKESNLIISFSIYNFGVINVPVKSLVKVWMQWQAFLL